MKTAGHPQSKEADTAKDSRQQDRKQRVGGFHQVQQLQRKRGKLPFFSKTKTFAGPANTHEERQQWPGGQGVRGLWRQRCRQAKAGLDQLDYYAVRLRSQIWWQLGWWWVWWCRECLWCRWLPCFGDGGGDDDIGVDDLNASAYVLTRRRAGTAGRRRQVPTRAQEPARGRPPRAAELKIVYEFAEVEGNFKRQESLYVCENFRLNSPPRR